MGKVRQTATSPNGLRVLSLVRLPDSLRARLATAAIRYFGLLKRWAGERAVVFVG